MLKNKYNLLLVKSGHFKSSWHLIKIWEMTEYGLKTWRFDNFLKNGKRVANLAPTER